MRLAIASIALCGPMSGGCAAGLGHATVNSVDVGFVEVPDRSGPCARVLRVRYHIFNGATPRLFEESKAPAARFGATRQPIDPLPVETVTDDRPKPHLVHQTSTNDCFAAALATIWRTAGIEANLEQFMRASANPCGFGVSQPASFLQILYAANLVRTGTPYNYATHDGTTFRDFLNSGSVTFASGRQYRAGGYSTFYTTANVPYADFSQNGYWAGRASGFVGNQLGLPGMPPQSGPPAIPQQRTVDMPDMYRDIPWYYKANGKRAGGIYPVGGTSDLIARLRNGAYIMAGLRHRALGHTVLITGVEFNPSGSVATTDGTRSYTLDDQTRITRIRYLDPARPDLPEQWFRKSADEFLTSADFILAFEVNP